MKSYKEQGVVLHTLKYGDSGLVVYMLTRGHGRRTYMIQGVRSKRGRGNKGAVFQPMFLLEYEGLESPRAEMHRMKDVRTSVPLATIPFDVRKSTISLFMAEVLYRLIKEVEPNSPLFDFVSGCVASLDGLRDGVANFHLWFLVNLTSFLGFHPGNGYVEGGWFDIAEGIFTEDCPAHRIALAPHNARLLSLLMEAEIDNLGTLHLTGEKRAQFMDGMLVYFGYHLEAINHVRSLQILREVF